MYRIYYNDGTWMDYPELDSKCIEYIVKGFEINKTHAVVHSGEGELITLVSLKDIRAIRFIDEPKETKAYSPELSIEEKDYIADLKLAERLHDEMESSYSYTDDTFGEGDL